MKPAAARTAFFKCPVSREPSQLLCVVQLERGRQLPGPECASSSPGFPEPSSRACCLTSLAELGLCGVTLRWI